MKIAVSGAHGIGKTTMVKALAERLNLPVISEIARNVAKKHGFNSTSDIIRAEKSKVMAYQQEVFNCQFIAESLGESFISDRSVYDAIAYSKYYALPEAMTDCMLANANYTRRYDILFYAPVPHELQPKDLTDGFRMDDTASVAVFDLVLWNIIQDTPNKLIRLPESRADWLSVALCAIEEKAVTDTA